MPKESTLSSPSLSLSLSLSLTPQGKSGKHVGTFGKVLISSLEHNVSADLIKQLINNGFGIPL